MTKEIDEKKIYEQVKSKLEDRYDLVSIDYRDSIENAKLIQRCIDEKSMCPLYEEDYFCDAQYEAAVHYANELLKDCDLDDIQIEMFKTTEEFDEIRLEIEERDYSNPIADCLKNTDMRGRFTLFSNYDCWIPPYDAGSVSNDRALAQVMNVLSLSPSKVKHAITKLGGYVSGKWPKIQSREGKEIVKYDDFARSLLETPCYGLWTFFGMLNFDYLVNNDFDIENAVIPEGTDCGMFSDWNGGGTYEPIKTIRPLPFKQLNKLEKRCEYDHASLFVDERNNGTRCYSSGEVYGGTLNKGYLFE